MEKRNTVRNQREPVYPNHDHFREVNQCREVFSMPCVLVAAFLDKSAKQRLMGNFGLGHYELGRQLLPLELPDGRHTRLIIERLRPVLGAQPYEFVPATNKFPRPMLRTKAIEEDLVRLPLSVLAARGD